MAPPSKGGKFDLSIRKRTAESSSSDEEEEDEAGHESKKPKLDPESAQTAGGEGSQAICERKPSESYKWSDAYTLAYRNRTRLESILGKHFKDQSSSDNAMRELKKCIETSIAFLTNQLDAIHEKLELPTVQGEDEKEHRRKVISLVKRLRKRDDPKAREVKDRLRMLLVTFSLIGLRGDSKVTDETRKRSRNPIWEGERDKRISELQSIDSQYKADWRTNYWAPFAGDLEQTFSALEEAIKEREWMSIDRIDWENNSQSVGRSSA